MSGQNQQAGLISNQKERQAAEIKVSAAQDLGRLCQGNLTQPQIEAAAYKWARVCGIPLSQKTTGEQAPTRSHQ